MRREAIISEQIRAAFEVVKADPSIEIIEPLRVSGDNEIRFMCGVDVHPHPNAHKLPPRAKLRLVIDPAFPFGGIEVYVEDREIQGFPHQDSETGKLCLLPDRMASRSADRLRDFVGWAKDWLCDAATDQLLREGDPYELPDFSRRNFTKRMPTDKQVLFDESTETYDLWRPYFGKTGGVELVASPALRGLLARTFRADGGTLVREVAYPEYVADAKHSIYGRWVLLPSLIYQRHRPPQVIGELRHLCELSGIHLIDNLRMAWEKRNKDPRFAFLLFGYPIPRRVGQEPSEIHWQPVLLSNRKDAQEDFEQKFKPYGKVSTGGLWNYMGLEGVFGDGSPLPWGRSENISRERLYARGHHSAIAASGPSAIIGCGALGSVVAELLIRGGAGQAALFDKDRFEIGNQCRHTLDGTHIGLGKADSLAKRLQGCNPSSRIDGYAFGVPLTPDGAEGMDKAIRALADARLIVDCTGDEQAFQWLSREARRAGSRLVSIYVNFRATVLTLCISGRTTSCARVCERLYADIANGRTPVTADEHSGPPPQDALVIPGAGCWHPTFPAANSRLTMLAAVAVEVLEEVLAQPIGTDGVALLIRRNAGLVAAGAAPPVQIVWNRRYR